MHQYNRMTFRSSRKSKNNLAEAKSLNILENQEQKINLQCPHWKLFLAIDTRSSMEKAVSPVCCIKIKVWATVVASHAMNLKNYKKWLKAIESELKNTRATTGSDVAVVLRYLLNIPQKVTSTIRWAFKVKSDRSSKARHTIPGWRQKHGIDREIAFVCLQI